MTMLRIAVARLESTSARPTFAKMATRAAKNAESKARINHQSTLITAIN